MQIISLLLLIVALTATIFFSLRKISILRRSNEALKSNEETILSELLNSKARENELIVKEQELKKQIIVLNSENEILADKIGTTTKDLKQLSSQRQYMDKRIKEQFEELDSICQILYTIPDNICSASSFPKALTQYLQHLRSEKSLEYYDDIIDFYSNGWIENIKSEYPTMRTQRLRLARYLYMGLCSESIAFLMNKKSKKLIDTDKSKLKASLLKNQDITFVRINLKKLGLKTG